MKKFLIALLSIVMVIGMFACSKNDSSIDDNSNSSTIIETYSITYYVVDDKGITYDWDKFKIALKEDGAYPTSVKEGDTAIIDSLIEESFQVRIEEKLKCEFIFLGWHADEGCSELLTGNKIEISLQEDISVYAKLECKGRWSGPF